MVTRPGQSLAWLLLLLPRLAWSGAAAPDSAPPPQPPTWSFFAADNRAFAAPLADPREARFRYGVLLDERGELANDLTWGADLGIIGRHTPTHAWTLTARGLVAARFQTISSSFDLLDTTFVGGLALGLRVAPGWSGELLLWHQSSHLGDELLDRQARGRLDAGHEAVRLLVAWRHLGTRVLAGGSCVLHGYPDWQQGAVLMRLGGEQAFRLLGLRWLAGAEVGGAHARDWQPRLVAQFAVELTRPSSSAPLPVSAHLPTGASLPLPGRQRLFLEGYWGPHLLGQWPGETEAYGLLGLAYDFR